MLNVTCNINIDIPDEIENEYSESDDDDADDDVIIGVMNLDPLSMIHGINDGNFVESIADESAMDEVD